MVHRSAIHAINAALLVFWLPMRAVLVTLGVLGRESLTISSRTTAVTGAGLEIAQNASVATFVMPFI